MTGAVLSYPERHRFDVSSLRWAVGGGERTPEARIRSFSEFFSNARYVDGYGLTESCSGDTLMEAGREIEKTARSVGALAHVEIEICDDDGRLLGPQAEGEICLRGPKVTGGYWRDPANTAAAFRGDWFRTGDVGYLDAEGFLYITDRKKDMIISAAKTLLRPRSSVLFWNCRPCVRLPLLACPTKVGREAGCRRCHGLQCHIGAERPS